MTSAEKRMSIRIDKNAFEQFLKENAPGMKMAEIAVKIGVNNTSFSHAKGNGYFSLENLSRMSKFFDVNMWSLPFVNDEAYTISFKLTTDLNLHLRAKMVDQIRGLLASGIPQDKVRDIVLSDIFAGKYTRSAQSDSESKACLAPATPTITDHIPEYEPVYPGLLQSELSEAKDRIAHIEETLSSWERIEAKELAQAIVAYLEFCSEDRTRSGDEDANHMRNIIKCHEMWFMMHRLCRYLEISVKERPTLPTVYFFIVNGRLPTGCDRNYVDYIKRQLYEEVEFIGRYPIKTKTDTDDKACEKEEEQA